MVGEASVKETWGNSQTHWKNSGQPIGTEAGREKCFKNHEIENSGTQH